MRRTCRKWLKVIVLSGMFAFVSGAVASNAHDILYTDENVSLSTAIDRCIASGTDILETEYSVNVPIGEGVKIVVANDVVASKTDAESDAESEVDAQSDIKATVEVTAVARVENKPEAKKEEADIEDNQTVSASENGKQENYDFFSGKAIVVASDYVNIRKGAGTDNEIIATILPDGIIRVKETGSEWTCIVSAGLEGYIKNDYLLFGNEAADYAMANLDDINATYNAIMAKPVEKETSNNNGGQTDNGASSQPSAAETPATSGSGVGTDIANFALQYVGYPYVYGGTSLTNGADCSGFVMTVYKNFGYSLPRTADDQSLAGVEVSRENIQPGDLIFYDYGTGVVQHVAIYTGNGQMVHAANTRLGIISGNAFYSSVISIRRIVN